MNEQNMNRVNTLQDVALMLPQLYSESSAKAYSAAFNRVEKLTGQKLSRLPADGKVWADLSAQIVWAGAFKGRTPQAAERAFEAWRGKIGSAIKRAAAETDPVPGRSTDAAQAWNLISGYVKSVENTLDEAGARILPNMSSLSIANLRARLKNHMPVDLTPESVERAFVSLPANKASTFRRSVRFFDRLITERQMHSPIAELLPKDPLGPLRTLRDNKIDWSRFSDNFTVSFEQMITVAIRGHRPRHDPLATKIGADPLASRRAARKHRRKPVRNVELAKTSYKAAVSWLARHSFDDREEAYRITNVKDLLTAENVEKAVSRYASRAKDDPALMEVKKTSSLNSYLATLSTLARTNELDSSVSYALEDARWDIETFSHHSSQMSGVREAFVKKIERDSGIVRAILSGPRVLMQEAQRDLGRWDQLSAHARSRTLHLAMSAAMLALQLARPLRTKNINQLTISGPDVELMAPRSKGNPAWLEIGRDKIKNRRSIESSLPAATWKIVSFWIDDCREKWLEMHGGRHALNDTHLFPGAVSSEPICRQTLNTAWNRGIARLGLTGMTPHMMRHVTATMFLARHPGQYGTVADLLGDRTETVEAFYARGAGQEAARLFADVLEELDPTLKLHRRAR